LEAEVEKKRQADKAEEERIVEIKKRLEIKKKEKAQADNKRQQELEKKKKEEQQQKKGGRKERGTSCQKEGKTGGAKGGKADKTNCYGNYGVSTADCSSNCRG
jgi:hypothetical protein